MGVQARVRTIIGRGASTRGVARESILGAGSPWVLPGLLHHPDGRLRQRRLAAAIRNDHVGGSVLAVGDPYYQLRGELGTTFDVVSTDIRPAQVNAPVGALYRMADFSNPGAFGRAEYDIVASCDVFEHIPPDHRKAFLAQAARVARTAAYIAFPAGPQAEQVEATIAATQTRTLFRDALEEHKRWRLPRVEEVRHLLEGLELKFEIRALSTIPEWLSSFVLCPADGEDHDLVFGYWQVLEDLLPAEPTAGPAYRQMVVIRNG